MRNVDLLGAWVVSAALLAVACGDDAGDPAGGVSGPAGASGSTAGASGGSAMGGASSGTAGAPAADLCPGLGSGGSVGTAGSAGAGGPTDPPCNTLLVEDVIDIQGSGTNPTGPALPSLTHVPGSNGLVMLGYTRSVSEGGKAVDTHLVPVQPWGAWGAGAFGAHTTSTTVSLSMLAQSTPGHFAMLSMKRGTNVGSGQLEALSPGAKPGIGLALPVGPNDRPVLVSDLGVPGHLVIVNALARLSFFVVGCAGATTQVLTTTACGDSHLAADAMPWKDGFLVATAIGAPAPGCTPGLAPEPPTRLQLLFQGATPDTTKVILDLGPHEAWGFRLLPRSDGAWLVYRTASGAVAQRLDADAMPTGTPLSIDTPVAALGDRLIVGPTMANKTVRVVGDTSATPAVPFPAGNLTEAALLGSPSGDKALVTWIVACGNPGPARCLKAARVSCAP